MVDNVNEQAPAEALARARYEAEQFEVEHPWYVGFDEMRPTLRRELVEDAEVDIAHLDAAGFRVSSKPDDDTRREVEELVAKLSDDYASWMADEELHRAGDLLATYVLGEVRSDG